MTTIEKIRQKQAQQPTGATSLAQPEPSSAEERRQWEAFKAMGGEWVMIRSRCQDCFQLIQRQVKRIGVEKKMTSCAELLGLFGERASIEALKRSLGTRISKLILAHFTDVALAGRSRCKCRVQRPLCLQPGFCDIVYTWSRHGQYATQFPRSFWKMVEK